MRKIAIIEFDAPVGSDKTDQAEFIEHALSSWGGGLHPEDPMFNSLPNIKIISIKKVKK